MNQVQESSGVRLEMPASLPVAEKIERLQSFLGENYFHPNGMMYCMWHYKEGFARPFQESDIGQYRYDFVEKEKITHKGWFDSENSISTSGLYLWSQALRYQVTGEAKAMAYARKAFRSLKIIFAMGAEFDKPGFFGKPWEWKSSTGTSPDQYICAMHGMWAYREIADREDRLEIDRMLPLMADWWRNNDYTLVYHGTVWPILPHHAPAMACMHDMAYRASGKTLYLDESRRLLTMAEGWPTWIDRNRREMIHPVGWPVEKKGNRWPAVCHGLEYEKGREPYLLQQFEVGEIWLTMACSDYFMRESPSVTPVVRHAISRQYKYMQFGLREDLLTLMVIQTDLERDTWHPIRKPAKAPGTLAYETDLSEICWGDFASRVIDAAVIGHQHSPDYCAGAQLLAKRMFAALDERRLRWMIDPDGEQCEPAKKWILHFLSSDVPSFACLAYWRARLHGIAVE